MKRLTKDSIIWPDLTIFQNKNGYRFSLDSIVLSRLVKARKSDSVLEIGSGSGVILLLLARLTPAKKLVGVELQKSLYELSQKNIKVNRLQKRIRLIHGDINKISAKLGEKFSIVLSNPPYYKKNSGRLNKNPEDTKARHETTLALETLIECAKRVLFPKGKLYLIYNANRTAELLSHMSKNAVEPKLFMPIHANHESPARLVWVMGINGARPGLEVLQPLVCYDKFGNQTSQMRSFFSQSNRET